MVKKSNPFSLLTKEDREELINKGGKGIRQGVKFITNNLGKITRGISKGIKQEYQIPKNVQVKQNQIENQNIENQESKENNIFITFNDLLIDIQNNFKPSPVIDEKELHNTLKSWLEGKYSTFLIRKGYPLEYLGKVAGYVDLGIENYQYFFEIKLALSAVWLKQSEGEIFRYNKCKNNIAVIVLDVGLMNELENDLFFNDLEQTNIKYIILKGMLRKRGKRKK